MRMFSIVSLVLLATALFPSAKISADVLVLVNPSVTVDAMDRLTVEKIFLGKKTRWDDGSIIVPVTLNDGPVHQKFLAEMVKKSPYQFATYWKRVIFTGEGLPFKSFDKESDVEEFLVKTKGSIGYLDSTFPHDGLKPVNVTY